MSSIADRYLPVFHYAERHHIDGVVSTPALIFGAIHDYDDRRDPVLNALLKVREAPSRLLARVGGDATLRERERFGLKDFHVLEQRDDAIAFGLTGKFWQANYGLTPIADAAAFTSHQEPGGAKLVMSYTLAKAGDGSFTISTETRVWCHDTRARLSFLPYWLMIRPASGWIRRRILAQLKAEAGQSFQATQRVPG